MDVTEILKINTNCNQTNGGAGVRSCCDTICFPTSYGSSFCSAHVESPCTLQFDKNPSAQWCYVDYKKCKWSNETLYKSRIFKDLNGLYFSFSTCNPSWDSTRTETLFTTSSSSNIKEGMTLRVSIPESSLSLHYKKVNGEILNGTVKELYDDSIPWEGAAIDYMNDVVKNCNLLGNIEYHLRTPSSEVSRVENNESIYDASVRDTQIGLVDFSLGSFYVTAARLEKTTFTEPFGNADFYMVIPEPVPSTKIYTIAANIFEPWKVSVWLTVGLVIIIVSSLSVWFATPNTGDKSQWIKLHSLEWRKATLWGRIKIYAKLSLDTTIECFTDFCGQAIDMESESMGFERKILNAGFSFVVLIFISAYVANLAAYLTNQKLEEYVKTVSEAVKHNRTICAPDVVQSKLEGKYPDAKRAGLFVFLADYDEAFQKFNDDTCQLIAMDENFFSQHSARFHKDHELNVRNQNLKVTLQPILSVPMAFPARRNIATALSYCMVIALERNIDIKNYIQKYRVKSNVMAEQVDYNIYISILDGSHITSLDVQHMIGKFNRF